MLKTGDIIYKVTLEGYDIPCVVVKKYKVGQRLSNSFKKTWSVNSR